MTRLLTILAALVAALCPLTAQSAPVGGFGVQSPSVESAATVLPRHVPFTKNVHGTPGQWSLLIGGGGDTVDSLPIQGVGAGAKVVAKWKSGGVDYEITVVQGTDELPGAFANRAKVTVDEMKAAFPVDPTP